MIGRPFLRLFLHMNRYTSPHAGPPRRVHLGQGPSPPRAAVVVRRGARDWPPRVGPVADESRLPRRHRGRRLRGPDWARRVGLRIHWALFESVRRLLLPPALRAVLRDPLLRPPGHRARDCGPGSGRPSAAPAAPHPAADGPCGDPRGRRARLPELRGRPDERGPLRDRDVRVLRGPAPRAVLAAPPPRGA